MVYFHARGNGRLFFARQIGRGERKMGRVGLEGGEKVPATHKRCRFPEEGSKLIAEIFS